MVWLKSKRGGGVWFVTEEVAAERLRDFRDEYELVPDPTKPAEPEPAKTVPEKTTEPAKTEPEDTWAPAELGKKGKQR